MAAGGAIGRSKSFYRSRSSDSDGVASAEYVEAGAVDVIDVAGGGLTTRYDGESDGVDRRCRLLSIEMETY